MQHGKIQKVNAEIVSRYTAWMARLSELAPDLAAKVPPLPQITPVLVRAYARDDVYMVEHLIRQLPWYPSPTSPWEILGEELAPEKVAASPAKIWFSGL